MLVKICGIKNLSVAKSAVKAGADFLGFNFVPTSSRFVTRSGAQEIIASLPARPKIVGVFQDQPIAFVNETVSALGLDYVQLHGNESPEYCGKVNVPVIKAFGLDSDFDAREVSEKLSSYHVAYYLLDRADRQGGLLNGEKVKSISLRFPIILAGGLTPENVRDTLALSGNVIGVDVAGGVETEGEKDISKIQAFIREVKGGQVAKMMEKGIF